MRGFFLEEGDGRFADLVGQRFDTKAPAHNEQFLLDDPACVLQLRRLLSSDLPPGKTAHGATALLVMRNAAGGIPVGYTVRADRRWIKNSRAGVLHAIDCLVKVNPGLARTLRRIADTQKVWGEPD